MSKRIADNYLTDRNFDDDDDDAAEEVCVTVLVVLVTLKLYIFMQWKFITSAKEVMFLSDFVCLSVCLFVCVLAR